MREMKHAIMMTSDLQGWRWQLIDPSGVTAASGVSTDQDEAMEAAWRAAKHTSNFMRGDYTEIAIRHNEGLRRARATAAKPR